MWQMHRPPVWVRQMRLPLPTTICQFQLVIQATQKMALIAHFPSRLRFGLEFW
jgi:hypothetical protein